MSPDQRAYERVLRRQGYSLPARRVPDPVWKPWVGHALLSEAEVVTAIAELEACGLVPHRGRAKNWDTLIALGTILERTNRRAAVLDMGAARYSRILRSLYAYGYRRLVGIDLVPVVFDHPSAVEHLTMDMTRTTFEDESFDAITCLSVIEHGVDADRFAREVGRLLRPGGVAIVSTDYWCSDLDVRGKSAYGVPVHVLSPDDISVWVEAAERHGLELLSPVDMRCQDAVVHWERVDLDFTFFDFVLVRGHRRVWQGWRRARYRPGSVVDAPVPVVTDAPVPVVTDAGGPERQVPDDPVLPSGGPIDRGAA